jgi:uncharacterized protein YciI
MPLFAVHALDRKDALPLRLEHYAAHRAYVESDALHGVNVVLSGPLQSADGDMMIGSLFIIAAETQQGVEAFVQADPFHQAGVWDRLSISRFHRRKGWTE